MADISHLVIFAAEEVEDAVNDVNPTADNVLLMNIFGANLKPTDFIRASRFRSRYMRIIKARIHKIRSLKKFKNTPHLFNAVSPYTVLHWPGFVIKSLRRLDSTSH